MPRRRTVVLASAAVLLSIGVVLIALVVGLTRTDPGRQLIRRYVISELSQRVRGKVYLGRFRGSIFGDVSVDSVEIRDPNDSLFLASGPVSARFRPGDLIDRRIRIALASVTRPVIHVRKDSAGTWNFRSLFPAGPPKAPAATRGFGDYVVLDSLRIRDGEFALTMPWEPDDTLRGAKRDSAIAFNLTRADREVRRAGNGFARTFRWSDIRLDAGYVRVAHPDSAGQFFQIHRLDVDESVPPLEFSKARGTLRLLGDSLWADLAHFELPDSRARGNAKVWWGSDPTRYEVSIDAQRVALRDIAWVYETLPREGGGSTELRITNARDPDIIDYVLTDMDVRTGNSRLRGAMTFAVGGPVLEVRDVALTGDPVQFSVLEEIAGEPFPYRWRGDLYGSVTGRGGPLNNFLVQSAAIEFRDANVPGAVTRGSASGGLNIMEPSLTVFRGFAVELEQLDLRTLQFLDPEFPRLNGTIAGSVRLDSLWTDVRLSDADLVHRDGASPATRVRGSGRVTVGEEFLAYDLALTADSLSFTTLAKSYPGLPLRGSYVGPLRLQGTLADLSVTSTLGGPAGTIGVDGTLDGSPPGYAFTGVVEVSGLDLSALLDSSTGAPRTSLTGRASAAVRGDTTLASLVGQADVQLQRGMVDSVRLFASEARLRFADARLQVDTLAVESALGRLEASGALGLAPHLRDSLRFVLIGADSLGALRRYIADGGRDGSGGVLDSLLGRIDARGVLVGSLDSLAVTARFEGDAVHVAGQRARGVRGDIALTGLTDAIRGTVNVAVDTAVLGDVALASADLQVRFRGAGVSDVLVSAVSMSGPTARAVARATSVGDTLQIGLDSLTLRIDDHAWSLERPASLVSRAGDLTIERLALLGEAGASGRIMLEGRIPKEDPLDVRLAVDSVALGDLSRLLQTRLPLGGRASVRADIRGTRAAPILQVNGLLRGAEIGGFRIARGDITAAYSERRLTGQLSLYRDTLLVLTAEAVLPLDLALERRAERKLAAPLSGRIRSNNVDLALLESFTPQLQRAAGRFDANIDLAGTWESPRLTGNVRVGGGAFGIAALGRVRFRDVNADLELRGDSVHINRLVAVSGNDQADSAWMRGSFSFADMENPRFNLEVFASEFEVMSKRSTAELILTGNLALRGALRGSELTGRLVVDRGIVYIPELTRKEVISLADPSAVALIDTTLFTNRQLLPKAPPTLVRNLTIRDVRIVAGEDVWLRSREANIKLAGTLEVTKGTMLGTATPQLALVGVLETVRGSYALDIGGVVRRLFEVEGGTLRFFGDPDFNPTLNIRAVHTVAVLGAADFRNEARIRVILEGTIARPTIRLESAEGPRYSESDLLSLLVTGAPSFQEATTASNAQLLALGVLTTTASSRFREALSLDLFSIRSGVTGGGTFGTPLGPLADILFASTLGIGKQVGSRSFVSLSYGLCAISPSTNTLNFAETLGLRFEHRFQAGLGLSLSREPASQSATCGVTGTRTFSATPPQYGIDIFRAWRY
ncbi:MAG: translocation/assembly module TamB domain-containing protein [Gemmatimonadaceae bacterium]